MTEQSTGHGDGHGQHGGGSSTFAITAAVVMLLVLYAAVGYAIVWVLHALWRAT